MFLAFIFKKGTIMNRIAWVKSLGKDGVFFFFFPTFPPSSLFSLSSLSSFLLFLLFPPLPSSSLLFLPLPCSSSLYPPLLLFLPLPSLPSFSSLSSARVDVGTMESSERVLPDAQDFIPDGIVLLDSFCLERYPPPSLVLPHPSPFSGLVIPPWRSLLCYVFSVLCSPVLRSPFSVLPSPFSVLRSLFSVLRSPFSVLRFPFSVFRFPFSVLGSRFSLLLPPLPSLLTYTVMWHNKEVVFYLAYLAASILGNFNPLFFSFHLLQILLRSSQLMVYRGQEEAGGGRRR
jgi:hypothetical protein